VTWRTLMACSVFCSLKANLLAEKYGRGAAYPPASRLMRGQTSANPCARNARTSLLGRASQAPTGGRVRVRQSAVSRTPVLPRYSTTTGATVPFRGTRPQTRWRSSEAGMGLPGTSRLTERGRSTSACVHGGVPRCPRGGKGQVAAAQTCGLRRGGYSCRLPIVVTGQRRSHGVEGLYLVPIQGSMQEPARALRRTRIPRTRVHKASYG
jgi:hypothetical protein